MPDLERVFAAAVRAERSRSRWTQADLAVRMGWSVSQVSQLELGRRSTHLLDLPLLCRVLDVGLGDLLARADVSDLSALRLGDVRPHPWAGSGARRKLDPRAKC